MNIPKAMLYVPAIGTAVVISTPQMANEIGACNLPMHIGYTLEFSDLLYQNIQGNNIAVGLPCQIHLEKILKEINPDIQLSVGEYLIEELRAIKDDKEISNLRKIAKFTDDALDSTIPLLKPGVTSREVQSHLTNVAKDFNMPDLPFPATSLFEKMGTPFRSYYQPDTPLELDSSIAFDFGYMFDGYCSDFGRSFYCGQAPEYVANCYKTLMRAQVTLINSIIPNQTNIKDMYPIIRDVAIAEGYVEHLLNYADVGVLGHQIGIDVHEVPWIHIKHDEILKPNMVMCLEPKMKMANMCYLRVEDMVLITQTGAESLTTFDRELFQLDL